jgi:hypothetical protein
MHGSAATLMGTNSLFGGGALQDKDFYRRSVRFQDAAKFGCTAGTGAKLLVPSMAPNLRPRAGVDNSCRTEEPSPKAKYNAKRHNWRTNKLIAEQRKAE